MGRHRTRDLHRLRGPRLLEDVLDFAEKEARRIVADELAEHHERRQAARQR